MARRRTYPRKHRDFLNSIRSHYDMLLAYQDGKCAICKRLPSERRRFDLDHNHRQMFLRGLLCVRCNIGLSDWMTAEWCDSAANYLRERDADWFTKLISEGEE